MRNHYINSARRYIVAFFVLTLLAYTPNIAAKSFFWQIDSPTTTVYLLGSIHFARSDIYPLDIKIEDAFKQSSILVVELDQKKIDKADMRRNILQNGMYESPDSIESHISEKTLNLLKEHLDRYDMPLQGYNRMKPGFLAMTLSIAHVIRLGYLPENGIDMYFLNKAQDKTILQLETYTDQINLFFNMPNEEMFLQHTLLQLEEMEEQIQATVSSWKNGDTQQMVENILIKPQQEQPELRQIYEKIYTERNITMTEKIAEFLQQRKKYFVVVGAGHLVGEQGIVELLSKRGFKATQY